MSSTENRQSRIHNRQPESSKVIPLFYWSEREFLFKKKENYGDLLGKYLVERISGNEVKWVHPKKWPWYKWDKTNYLTAGSIIHHANKNSIVWGSGIIDHFQSIASASFRAVRGPRTRKYLMELGYQCPEIFGDPAILLPRYFNPLVKKKYRIGIIPHYNDYMNVVNKYSNEKDVKVIDLMCLDVEAVTRLILECEKTISSSLHGLIISHAYKISSIWVEFSDKIFGDGIKYIDYLESVDLPFYKPEFIQGSMNIKNLEDMIGKYPNLPTETKINELQNGLLNSCPFI